jgi:hypothetical protein
MSVSIQNHIKTKRQVNKYLPVDSPEMNELLILEILILFPIECDQLLQSLLACFCEACFAAL